MAVEGGRRRQQHKSAATEGIPETSPAKYKDVQHGDPAMLKKYENTKNKYKRVTRQETAKKLANKVG